MRRMDFTCFTSFFLVVFLLANYLLCSAADTAEIEALMEMKSSLDPKSLILYSWTNNGNPCDGSFVGVGCNENGKVANISLQGKGLSGTVPSSVAALQSLTGLYLHYNSLTGQIPKEISKLNALTDLYLNVNGLSGGIPMEIGSMPNLQTLQLCCNQLGGSIPKELGSLQRLSVLALQNNKLTGAIPATLGDLSMLTRLDVSSNQLFGSIPSKLVALSRLTLLDVRNNSLSGNVPSELKRLNEDFLYDNNKNLCGAVYPNLRICNSADLTQPIKPEPYGGTDSTLVGNLNPKIPESANVQQNRCSGQDCRTASSLSTKSPKSAILIGVVALAVGGIVCSLFLFSLYRRRKQKIGSTLEAADSRLSMDVTTKDFSRKSASPLISLEYGNGWDPLSDDVSRLRSSPDSFQSFRFNLEEVESATQYFSDVNLLGKTNFSSIHRGILRDGSVVAVRSINKTSCKTEEDEFLKGLKVVALLRHENLVKLRGFCCSRGRGECFLVYDFVPNGSLANYLDVNVEDGQRILDWSSRVWIICGIAKGIEYLHGSFNKPPLVHQNISAEKVLLDQHFNPLIADPGLHKLLADDVVFSTLKASAAMGYLAPGYTTIGRFTDESDVYAFGILVLQILSGKRRVDLSIRHAESGNLIEFMDTKLQGNYSETEAVNIIRTALCCTSETPNQRPSMTTVVQELNSRNS